MIQGASRLQGLVSVGFCGTMVSPMTIADSKCLRIFVVENDEDTLEYFRMYLESSGHQVWEARTVAEAIEKISESECDVLICDVDLTDGTGWELLQRLRESRLPHPPFAIAMSGFGMNTDRLRSAAAGFRHHLLKPIDVDDLDELLSEAGQELAV